MMLSHRHLALGVSIFITILNRIVLSQSTNDVFVTTPHTELSAIATHNEGGWDPPDPSLQPDYSIAPGINVITEDQNGLSVQPTGSAAPTPTIGGTELLLGGMGREGYFSPQARVELPHILDIRGYTSLSLRTCSYGRFLHQVAEGSDALSLSLNQNGHLTLTITRLGQDFVASVPHRKLNDNQWHRIYLKYELGTLYLGADSTSVVVANTTSANSELLNFDLASAFPRLVVGEGIAACILEGANTQISANESAHVGVEWNECALPVGRNCSGYLTDPCFVEPCGKKGICVAAGQDFFCQCYSRFSGTTCEFDAGPLCQTMNPCQNGGVCQEDHLGNATSCACPTEFMGPSCGETVQSRCQENPCMNNGTCVLSEYGDRLECVCPTGFRGDICDEEDNFCTFDPCLHGGSCSLIPDGFICNCSDTGYRGDTCQTNIDECLELGSPCLGGSTCFDLYGGFECACRPGFGGQDCSTEMDECSSSPCQNGGLCTDQANDFFCECPSGFHGKACQNTVDNCHGIICPVNAVCVDVSGGHECQCQQGYAGIVPDCTKINACESNPCENEANCYDVNDAYTCLCQVGFTGSNCETNIDDCTGVYCENQGSCVDGINNHTCACVEGFTGPNCEHDLNECAQNVCVHAKRCIDLEGNYSCECETGWQGRNCDEEVDECESGPCQNNGNCTDRVGAFVCNCPQGFEGDLCEINIDECASDPCQNNGTCVDDVDSYQCNCTEDFMGENCEEIYDACTDSPCYNGASCIATPGKREYYCECLDGFEGLDCSNNINECAGVSCPDGKVCFDLINRYECRCPEGFSGDTCSVNINECESSPCLNGGTCHDATANYTCVCPAGYTGHNCEDDVDECVLLSPCMNGICFNTNGSYQCYCLPGFSGSNCSLEFDECLYEPCFNGGTCINMINSYQCQCLPGFTGSDCETDIDECLSQPCQNNATCIDGIANFTCQCVPGFTDTLCATNIDECESGPCLNGGECQDGINMYDCYCNDTGFKGLHCEINIDDCESSPCQHGSNCTDLIKDYDCSCYDGYAGKNCEQDIEECASGPCQNDGVCYERSNLTYYEVGIFSDFSYDTAGGFICDCQLGFTGDSCEINIDECESSPCVHGICHDGINSYECQCQPGYEGEHCEHEIDECQRYAPCVHGTCVDKIADYDCECATDYGGKNCSVLLIGCSDVECVNGGTCVPLLFEEIVHEFRCDCPPGFTGRNCELVTTVSMNGDAYLILDSQGTHGYDLRMSFRTTLPSVVLAVGQGEDHYFTLVLQDGRLKLHSSFLSRYNGIYSGSELNNGEWQFIQMFVNDTHSLLTSNNETTQNLLSPSSTISFTSTFLGGVTPNLKILVSEPSYTGCMRDVSLNDNDVILSELPQNSKVNVVEGCNRVPQCQPNPCHNDGQCVDLWTSMKCLCKRPYLGDTCRMSFTPATFGNEDIRDSLATVNIPPSDQQTFRRYVDISMLVRTKQDSGLIFYLGSPLESANQLGEEGHSYLLAELVGGHIVVKVRLGGPEEIFETISPYMADGQPHLLHVERENDQIYAKVDDKLHLNVTLENNGDLLAQILYLGGVPVDSRRVKRQLGVSIITPESVNNHFKGVLQDIRLSAGNETLYVELFPLEVIPDENFNLSGTPLTPVDLNNVLNGTVSDDTCFSQPCLEGGNCTITFNDFECACPSGFKGKICDELEYCAMFQCPMEAECQNLIDGYECLSNATFNGRNSALVYDAVLNNTLVLNTFSTMYRSKVGGVLMAASVQEASVWVGVGADTVVVQQVNGSTVTTRFNNETILDGQWHHLSVTFDTDALQVSLDGNSLLNSDMDPSVVVDFNVIVRRDGIQVGSLPEGLNLRSDIRMEFVSFLDPNQTSFMEQHFRGCMSDSRVQNVLLPFYSPEELSNNTAANVFNRMTYTEVDAGCEVCFQHECLNGGQCLDPANTFTCACPDGFEGGICETNIDECVFNECVNNATCVDGIFGYTCDCLPGYDGQFCSTEIDECAVDPCRNGGTCIDEIAAFTCICAEEFIGDTCSELKVKNCSNDQCENGAICNNIFNPLTGIADNYTCECPFSYNGYNCEMEVDFCTLESVHCMRGNCILTHVDKGWICNCEEGFEGVLCNIPTNECDPDPCLNGGICEDHFLAYECVCQQGWEGDQCEENINECAEIPNLCNGGDCIDADGGYYCDCPYEFCGQHCTLLNPCSQENAINCTHGECTNLCDERTNETLPVCRCNEGWKGEFCEVKISALSTEYLSIIIGVVVSLMVLVGVVGLVIFFMMAKKKRETSGTYSPSKQEFYSPRVEMGNMMKPPPEERLI